MFTPPRAIECRESTVMKAQNHMLQPQTVVKRTSDHLSADLGGGETVLMSVEKGMYYGLDEVASRIWDLLASPIAVSDLCDRLILEYDVDRRTCERQVTAYLEDLRQEGLVETIDDPAS